MNIIEFKEKVYQRIITQYMKDVKKTKIVWSYYLFFLKPLISVFLIFVLNSYFVEYIQDVFSFFMFLCVCFSTTILILMTNISFFINIKKFINFKKQSDIFWGTTLTSIPVLDDYEMKKFLLQDDIWHCKHAYTNEQIESLVALIPKEIEEMSLISFNKGQKDFIINSVKGGIKIDFYSLSYLLKISDEDIAYQKLLVQQKEKKNIDDNQTILKAIKYDLVPEQIIPVNQKVKYLL